jgi:hypothetical protein
MNETRINRVLGLLCGPELSWKIAASCEESAALAFKKSAVFFLESLSSLVFLVGHRANFDSSDFPGKPSYVPTWKSYTTDQRGHYLSPSSLTTEDKFNAADASSAEYRFSDDKSILYVKGAIIGVRLGIATLAPFVGDSTIQQKSRRPKI